MRYLALVFTVLFSIQLFAQHQSDFKNIQVHKISSKPKIDGVLDEQIWQDIEMVSGFIQYFPTDTLPASNQTYISMAFDSDNLYVAIRCLGDDWVVNSLRRDYRAGGNDNITLVFDSFEDETNAFFFGINPEGVIREGVITGGGNQFSDFDESWDNKWRGEAKKFDGYYTAELEIPFGALRYTKGSQVWNFGAYRFDTQHNEWSTWTGIPQNAPLMCLAYNGKMIWEEPLEATKGNYSLIPFVAAGVARDFEAGEPNDWNFSLGGDAKIGVTSGLNLDVTLNPDFSQVEVDRQITDLSRFEIFFPERRQFFLENADLFSQFGFGNINPFFSRRIGVAENLDGDNIQNKIYGGLRLSGKLSDDTRIGLLNMQTADDRSSGIIGSNYTVAALQQQVLTRSNISFLFVNKQLPQEECEEFDLAHFNRVAGIDFNYSNAANTWFGKTFLHSSFSPDQEDFAGSHGAELTYNTRFITATWSHEMVGADYNAETGFIRRTDYSRVNPSLELRRYPMNGWINELQWRSSANLWWQPGLGKTDHNFSTGLSAQFSNTARINLELNHDYVYLFDSFDPTGTDSDELPVDTEYNYVNFNGSFQSNNTEAFSYRVRTYLGNYFNGNRFGLSGEFSYRYQPKGSVSISYNYNRFDMPYLEEKKSTFLIGPRVDYTFSRKMFLTTFIQYNTQSQNTNINTRFQWRFAPVSDFFLVYTDNYLTNQDPADRFSFDIKNRAIVAKLTYWINS